MLIKTIEQLDALPDGAIIRDHMEDAHYKDRGRFFECGYHLPDIRSSYQMVRDIGGSFTVVYPRHYDDKDVEKVAKAIYEVEDPRYADYCWPLDAARAVLNALEEFDK